VIDALYHTRRHTHKHPVGLLWTRDRPVTETSTCTIHNIHRRQNPLFRRDSNPQLQQASSRRPAP